MKRPDPTFSLQGWLNQSKAQMGALQNQANSLRAFSSQAPAMQSFDAAKTSQQASEFGMDNIQTSKEFERLLNPETAKMRQGLGDRVAEATNLDATKKWMDQWAIKSGLGSDSLIGRSAIYDQATQEGRQAKLQNLQIQQGYLSQTPSPIGGLDPASIIAAEQAAKAQNLQSMQQYQGNVMQGSQQLNQSTTDWINSNLGQLQKINQVDQQNQSNYEQAMLKQAQQMAASENASKGAMITTGGAVAGAAIGAAIII
jgi:hypothetical protein